MNKKNDPDYQRKEVMLHKDIISRLELIAKNKKKSPKRLMEEIVTDTVNSTEDDNSKGIDPINQ